MTCALALAACGGGGGHASVPTPNARGGTSPGAACHYPTRLSAPAWLPRDLPLPPGTYLSERLADANGYHQGVFVVPGQLKDFVRFVLSEWPPKGWALGRGDAEANEAEDAFSRSPETGAFKVQGQACVPGYSLLLLVYTPDRTVLPGGVNAGPGTRPGVPIPVPSPSPSVSS